MYNILRTLNTVIKMIIYFYKSNEQINRVYIKRMCNFIYKDNKLLIYSCIIAFICFATELENELPGVNFID